ncbi:HAD-IIB family hydrolase [Chitinophaga silvatica]|uniref:HAD-IIB family hydrolase n=1 Tax=Chitinophaga silvatica TaxID=2282649 RepID=A0A3E1YA34_9BACT|nr:HAD-IIB family hydrolase [Chitinophaga silvatica]RFS22532.1 HAD-IIB family hydrolase [Chitinophaga silvatica]
MILATDLDGTFLGGDTTIRQQLYSLIEENKDIRLVFVTGRGIRSVLNLLEDKFIPKPEYMICDVGATVTHFSTLAAVEPVQSLIAGRWPGDAVRESMKEVKGLLHQEAQQQFRCSYYYDQHTDIENARAMAATWQCDLLLSAGKYLDVLPPGVNKGFTLVELLKVMAYPHEKVLVAGDSMNDLALFEAGFKGVVVGGAEEELVTRTANMPHVLQAGNIGAGGILEAMAYFSEFKSFLPKG